MIYTLGHRATYDALIENNPEVRKAVGGTVWQTYDDAELHRIICGLSEFSVYFVDEEWDNTEPSEDPDTIYNTLINEAPISKM